MPEPVPTASMTKEKLFERFTHDFTLEWASS